MASHVITIIAEVGVNHNGSLDTALRLIDGAADAGADIAKFQSFSAASLVTSGLQKAAYQIRQTGAAENQYEMLKALELDFDAHLKIIKHCQDRGIGFLSTPFDLDSLSMLVDSLGQSRIKVGSGDLTNAPHLLDIARRNCVVILSTGMATLAEVEAALGVLAFGYTGRKTSANCEEFTRAFSSNEGKAALQEKVTVLHCTTEYPAPLASINLRAMDTLAERFGLPTGFSDHSEGDTAAIAAAARGAVIIEKHLTLDRGMVGPDHIASMEPTAFADMVRAVREVEICLGRRDKKPEPAEIANISAARKFLVAKAPIAKGDVFSESNLTTKRAGGGITALSYFDWLGRKASRDFDVDEIVSP